MTRRVYVVGRPLLDGISVSSPCPFPLRRGPHWPSVAKPLSRFPQDFHLVVRTSVLKEAVPLTFSYILSQHSEPLQSSVSSGHFSNPFQIPSHVIGDPNSQLQLAFILKLELTFCSGSGSSFLMLSPFWPGHFGESLVSHRLLN